MCMNALDGDMWKADGLMATCVMYFNYISA